MVTAQPPLKPQSTGDTLFAATSEVSYASGDTLTLKGVSISVRGHTGVVDATGEADSFVTMLMQNRVSGEVEINGHVINGELIGFNNLPDDSVRVTFNYGVKSGTTHVLTIFVAITSLGINWSRKGATVPVTIRGRITKTTQVDQIREGATL